MTRAEARAAHELLHRLWSKAVGTSDYAKDEWVALERYLLIDAPAAFAIHATSASSLREEDA